MKKILTLNLDDKPNELDLTMVATRFSYEQIKINEFDSNKVTLTSTQNVLILLSDSIEKIEDFLKENQFNIESKIVLAVNFVEIKGQKAELINLCSYNIGIKGIIDLASPLELSLPIFNSFNTPLQDIDGKDLGQISQNLTSLVERSMTELQRVKKLHQKIAPVREDEFKGLKFLSKFAAGESPGGDYFDFIKNEQQGLIVLCSTKSYLMTSSLMARLESFRELDRYTGKDLKGFVNDFVEEVRELGKEINDISIDLLLFDMKRGALIAERFGNSSLKIGSLNCESSFETKLERESKIYLASDGCFLNTPNGLDGRPFGEFLENLSHRGSRECLDEAIVKIKTQFDQKFIKHDATVIVVEVPKNVFFEV